MIRIICLTEPGLLLAKRINKVLINSDIVYKPVSFKNTVQGYFNQGDRLIFICATGIVMRTLAPVINDKHRDPAVLVLDELGQFVIPLLSGHEGGANEFARTVAKLLDSHLVITTANNYLKPVYVVGMGCERDCPESVLLGLLEECLQNADITIAEVSAICSIDIKDDEHGLIALASHLSKPYLTFTTGQLSDVEDRLSTKSDYIFKTVGVYGVAESAALYHAQILTGNSSELLLNKQKNKQSTCAIARSYKA